jgi:alpha-glucosidase
LYSTTEEAHRTGVPILRPLLLNYQDDPALLDLADEFMIGSDLLVAPVTKSAQSNRFLYLPKGLWYDFWTRAARTGKATIQTAAPLDCVPLFARGGSIIPLGPEMNYVGEKKIDPLRFEIFPDEDGRATGSIYEDDGASMAFERGDWRRTEVSYSEPGGTRRIDVSAPQGTYRPESRFFEFVLPAQTAAHTVMLDGRTLRSIEPAANGPGWFGLGGILTIRIEDDGRARQIRVE